MNRLVGRTQFVRLLARALTMAAMWLTATTFFGMAYFLSGKRVTVEEAIIFTAAFANAAAFSAVTALTVGAKIRWALEAALPMALLIATPVGLAWAVPWLAPTLSWNLQTANFFPYRGQWPTAVLGIARQTIPAGAILSTCMGTIAGLVIRLGRRLPRLVGWFVMGFLLSCVVGFVHVVAFDRVVDFVVKTRLEGVNNLRVSWTIRFELASAIGATAGAFVGAVVAYGAVRLSERSLVSP
jgi:hypothetical protein